MAIMPNDMRIIAAPNTDIVDVACQSSDCIFNLINMSNTPDKKEFRCNLKQITIINGKCNNMVKSIFTNEKLHTPTG